MRFATLCQTSHDLRAEMDLAIYVSPVLFGNDGIDKLGYGVMH
jgi:hypothetical protein